ncbi:protein GRIP isoform X1 [Pistacia vera]|uniref:protein GRIP isoform X1 n=1 Tax=Pistacia vera TaxID=55513 RepID=UPI001262B5FD|nr:protein GRIP isoform X1 [Pistacia vera]XP_031276038.1 protein GRIP isoform X1 [Pistacia vera]XP_031276039.1 protein GRIP isoform X1 [Pistacia vera]XP_031276040.1 protein GRIP isoform X1 [Pistacia vera]
MSEEGQNVSVISESGMEDSLKTEKQLSDANGGSNGSLVKENGTHDDRNDYLNVDHDQLLEIVLELKFQNEILKSQFEGLKTLRSEDDGLCQQREGSVQESRESVDVKELHERINSLSKELHEEKETRGAAEKALEHLRVAYSEADAKAQEFSTKLAEAQQKLDHEIKEREEKYTELDSKFSRLHKRAKQRIQEVQKEKDDLEARLRDVTETADRTSSQHSALQQELERTRQQANDALKAMDAERQQLRSTNNKLRDNIEELRRSLQPKENALEALQQSLLEKEQMLEDMRASIQAAEEKRQASIAELSAKHQKNLESLEAQLADALSDRNKATETISSLQVLVAEKESKIAEMEAASTGKAARLRAAVETVKGEIAHLKHEHEKEKESWEAASQALKKKLEVAESNCIRAEIEAAKMRSQLESEMSVQTQTLSSRDAELMALKEEISRVESEFSSYKIRAHALLQKKDAELAAANDSEQLKALEEALKEAEKEVSLVSEERDKALQELQDALANHDKELAERDAVLDNAKQQIKNLEIKLDSLNAQHLLEKETWGRTLQNVEESWQVRCELLKSQNEASSGQDVQKELEELKLQYKRLKGEHDSFRDLADRMLEERDNEISRLLDENKNLQRSLESKPTYQANHNDNYNAASRKQDALNSDTSVAEQQILLLARQQAQREEELAQSQRHILALQEEIEELEHENRLHSQQEAMLKEELRNMERKQKREGVDMTYLKNVVVKLLETGEVEALLPVIAMLLQFSPEEMQKCQQAYRTSTDVPPTPASDASGSGVSLFSRFSFS